MRNEELRLKFVNPVAGISKNAASVSPCPSTLRCAATVGLPRRSAAKAGGEGRGEDGRLTNPKPKMTDIHFIL